MAAQIFVDARPQVKPHNGLYLATFASGAEQIEIMLTRHALRYLHAQCGTAEAMGEVAQDDTEIIEFPVKKRGAK